MVGYEPPVELPKSSKSSNEAWGTDVFIVV
jgi:hypothetical protein